MTDQRFDSRKRKIASGFASSIAVFTSLSIVFGSIQSVSAAEMVNAGTSPSNGIAARSISMTSASCRAFREQTLPNQNNEMAGIHTEQLVVIRDGQKVFDWNDKAAKPNAARGMWSVSKTLTATLIASAVQDKKISLEDPIVRYLPELLNVRGADKARLSKIKIGDLLSMTSGFKWTENTHASAKEQSDLSLLYSDGYPNMVKYIAGLKFDADPGDKWNYSSTNAVLAMAVLRKAYGSESNDMPWMNLFRPLDMKSARFEKDRAGNYVGSAYIHLSAGDLAKVGELYANDGIANGKRILPEGWVNQIAENPVAKSIKNVQAKGDFAESGAYSQGSFWLNKKVAGVSRAYPHVPESMMYASGLFGQSLIVLPEQHLVIARTAHDSVDTDAQLDPIVANAMKCFAPDATGTPQGAPVPLKKIESKPFDPSSIVETITDLDHTLSNGKLQGMIAKEVCSCHFITGLAVDECLSRSPIPALGAHVLADINTDEAAKAITISPRLSSVRAQARFNQRSPREGCVMTLGHAEQK